MKKLKALHPWLVVTICGVIGTLQYHLAQFTSGFDTFFGDRGDVRGVVFFCEHWYRALLEKAELLSPTIFYPTRHTLAYSDLLVALAIPYSLLRAFGLDMFTAMEVVVMGLTILNYVACFYLLHKTLQLHLYASCAGAMFFAFSSPKLHQLIHLQLQFVLFLPLILICIITFAQQHETISRRKAIVLSSLAVMLLMLGTFTTFYYVWFLVFWSIPFLAFSFAFRPSRLFIISLVKTSWRAFVPAAVLLVIGSVIFLLIYLPAVRSSTWYEYDFISQMIPTWWSLLSMGDGNYVWGWLTRVVTPNPPPSTWGELRIGIGLVASIAWLILTGWCLWMVKRLQQKSLTNPDANVSLQDAACAFLAAMVLATTVFYLISFSYGSHSPWYFVFRYFPGAGAIRAVSRYVIFLSLPLAIGLAYALHSSLQWATKWKTPPQRKALTLGILLLAGFGVFEQFGIFKTSGTGFSIHVENAYLKAMAGKLSPDCTVFYLAPGANARHNPAEYQYDAMLISIMSGVPTMNASMSQFPRGWGLYFVNDPSYEKYVKDWIDAQQIRGKVCRLEIGPQVDAFDPHAPSPLDDAAFFVRQHYRDFAGREPNEQELQAHVRNLQTCGHNYTCDRAEISLDIFRGTGFAADGSFIYRLYQVGYGRAPRFDEFIADTAALRTPTSKLALVNSFVTRDEFASRYATLSDSDYVNKLNENSEGSLSAATRQPLLSGQKSRGQILLETVEDQEVTRKFEHRAFVTLHYFGYLRRDPEANGYDWWLRLLDSTRDPVRVTAGFVNSVEYRQRFVQ